MRTRTSALIALALAGAALTVPASADPAPQGRTAIALVGSDKLVRVDVAEGGKTRGGPRVSGLVEDTGLVGIDYRPQDGLLYGLGNKGGIYSLASDGVATFALRLTIPLEGTSFGVDFNPAANALRVISDTGQNLRQPLAAFFDGNDQTPAAPTAPDGRLNYAGVTAVGVVGAAYTENDNVGATGTTTTVLYDIDTTTNRLVKQVPPNAGTLVDVGALGVDAEGVAGFDIFSTLDATGKAVAEAAYAVLVVDGAPRLYSVALADGTTSDLGALSKEVTDIALVYGQ